MKKQTIIAAMLAVFSMGVISSSNAILITIPDNLSLSQEQNGGIQHTDQGPCVIGHQSCNANETAEIGFTGLPSGNNNSVYVDVYSLIYSVGDVRAVGGNLFDIGIDVNITGNQSNAHNLINFVALIDGHQAFAYSGGAALQDFLNPGNGYSDWRLTGFDLTGIDDTLSIQFVLNMENVDAGAEEFFIISNPGANMIPEPTTLALLGLGLLGVGLLRRHRSA